ncbi:MAG: guanitoxin biosynthesis heme-dependent pre-guanitoxin N-hydroxylase GntA [Ferruginibacter sp.]
MDSKVIKDEFLTFLNASDFPCVAAKNAADKGNINLMVADHLGCPKDDAEILQFMYAFTEKFRSAGEGFHSAAVIFKAPANLSETEFDQLIWQRLASLRRLDAEKYNYDSRVDPDPASADFSFSLMEEAFFIIGLHSQSSRQARRFEYPTLIFNPHAQFTAMKKDSRYDKMKAIVRKRDLAFSGSVNPMLTDFGDSSEAYQYSGRSYESGVECPFTFNTDK